MPRPTEAKLRDQLIQHTRALRSELRGAFDRPASEIELAFQRRVNEIERQRPGRGPIEAAQEFRAGHLRDTTGRAFEIKQAPGARDALDRAADRAAKAFEVQLLSRYPQRQPGFDLDQTIFSESRQRKRDGEHVRPQEGPPSGRQQIPAGEQTIGEKTETLRDEITDPVVKPAPNSGEPLATTIGNPTSAPADAAETRPSAAAAGKSDPALESALQKVDRAINADAHAAAMRTSKENALDAAGQLKRIAAADKLVRTTERRFMAEMGKVYRDPMKAVKKFEKMALSSLDKAMNRLAHKPEKFGELVRRPRDGLAGRLLPQTIAQSRAHGRVLATYADSFIQAQKARSDKARTIEWRDPAGTTHKGWEQVKAAASKTLTEESLRCDKANYALKQLGGLHSAKMDAAKAVTHLTPEQRARLEHKVLERAGPAKGLLPYHKIMALQHTLQLGSSIMRTIDPA